MNKGIFIFTVLLLIVSMAVAVTDEQLQIQLEKNLVLKRQVFQQTLNFIQENPNLPNNASLYSNLAELSGAINLQHPEITLYYYQQVLINDPNFREKDRILYNIGFYVSQSAMNKVNDKRIRAVNRNAEEITNNVDSLKVTIKDMQPAIDAYGELIRDFPTSTYRSEAIFRLAVDYYQIGLDAERPVEYYQKASDLFNILANRSNDDLQYIGLFQRGWANLSSGLYEKSFSDFCSILSLMANPSLKLQVYYEDSSIENVAYSLVNLDKNDYVSNSEGALYAINHLPNTVSVSYGKKILLKAVQIKKSLNAPMQAIDFYNAYMTLYPNELENPSLEDSIIVIYSTNANGLRPNMNLKDVILAEKEKIISTYSVGSSWYNANKSNDLKVPMKIVCESYFFLEPYYWNEYFNNKSLLAFQKYAGLIARFQNTPELVDSTNQGWITDKAQKVILANYDLAEHQNNPKLYLELNQRIYQSNQDNPENTNYFQNERRAFICIEKLQELLKDKYTNGTYSDTTYTFTISSAAVDTLYLQGVERYLAILLSDKNTDTNKDDEIIHVIYGRSQIRQKVGDYNGATQDLLAILKYNLPVSQKRGIYTELAQLSEKASNFDQATSYYKEAESYALNAQDKQAIHDNYLVQMNNQADLLKSKNEYSKAAEEYLKLASEFDKTDQTRVIGYKIVAQDLYNKAGMYQKSIDLLLDVAKYKDNVNDIYILYVNAWTIADSLLTDKVQSEQLKNNFVTKYPKSVEAYQTRLTLITEVAKSAETKDRAANMYLDLYNDAVAGRINIGSDPKEDIYLLALEQYRQNGYDQKVAELSRNFARLYPNHPKALGLLEYSAAKYKEKGNEAEYHKMALEIYQKDPNSTLLPDLAKGELGKIYDEAVAAFGRKDWTTTFLRIDEFKQLDTSYQKEGLKLPLSSVYEDFSAYRTVYDAEMANMKFLKTYDDKLASLENGFLKMSPSTLLVVNDKTTWKQKLNGGDKRIQGLIDEANRNRSEVEKLLRTANDYDLDSQRRTKAILLIGKIYEHAAQVMDTQLEKYILTAREILELKGTPETYDTVVQMIRTTKSDNVLGLQDAEVFYLTYLIRTFSESTGYTDSNIGAATSMLVELNRLPSYEIVENILDDTWRMTTEVGPDSFPISKSQILPNITTTSKFTLGCIKIFPHQSITISRDIKSATLPSIAYMHIASSSAILVNINMQPLDSEPQVIDTVLVNGIQISHSLIRIDNQNLIEGINKIEIKVMNESDVDQYFAENLQIYYEKQATSALPETNQEVVQEDKAGNNEN